MSDKVRERLRQAAKREEGVLLSYQEVLSLLLLVELEPRSQQRHQERQWPDRDEDGN